jgi:23S rRNA (uracil1939-C5)-methyltransferase
MKFPVQKKRKIRKPPAQNTPIDLGEITLEIADLARSGAGVGRAPDGRAVFVAFTAPGDVVRVRLTKLEKRYAEADLIEIVKPSAVRQTPRCAVFGKCGGCQWQHIPYELQWKTKMKGVLTALARVEIVPTSSQITELPAEEIWNYRNRIQLRGMADRLGFYAAKSHERVSIDHCPIAKPELNQLLPSIRNQGKEFKREFKVELEVFPDGTTKSAWDLPHGSGGFRQVHDAQNEKLRNWIAQAITPGRHVYDLFGGAGNLATAVAAKASSVDCVDSGAPEGTTLADFPHLQFHKSSILTWTFKKSKSFSEQPAEASAILDPPREGLGEDHSKIATSLEKMNYRELIAVGCDVDSWARDVSRFVKRGWKVERFAILDLFPQTPHVESLTLLRR